METDYSYPGSDLRMRGYSKRQFENRGATHKYEVYRPLNQDEDWATDVEIINFCDNGINHFGGHVNKVSMYIAHVSVYVD